jgi:hypothetical protein
MRRKKENKRAGYFGHFTLYPARRSCFAKRFSKTVSDSTKNLLQQHSHNRS